LFCPKALYLSRFRAFILLCSNCQRRLILHFIIAVDSRENNRGWLEASDR